ALTASMMSARRSSMLSYGPMATARICGCGPSTCSAAATNSSARRPWDTTTTPIIQFSRPRQAGWPGPHNILSRLREKPKLHGCGSFTSRAKRRGLQLRRWRYRQLHHQARTRDLSLTLNILRINAALVGLNDLPCDGETEA